MLPLLKPWTNISARSNHISQVDEHSMNSANKVLDSAVGASEMSYSVTSSTPVWQSCSLWSRLDNSYSQLSLPNVCHQSMHEVHIPNGCLSSARCFSLCAECFHRGNHQGHDANMFRSVGGGLCDCGDQTVMRPSGFCKHHGQSRIPNESIPSHFIQGAQMIIPRLLVIQSERVRSPLATSHDGESQNRVECCICQRQDDQSVLGLAIRLFVTGGKCSFYSCFDRSLRSLRDF